MITQLIQLFFRQLGPSELSFSVLLDFSLTVKAATLILISGCGSAIPSAKEGKSGANFINAFTTCFCLENIVRSSHVKNRVSSNFWTL